MVKNMCGLLDINVKPSTLAIVIIGIIAVLIGFGYLFNWIGEYVDFFQGAGTPLLGIAGIIILIAVIFLVIIGLREAGYL